MAAPPRDRAVPLGAWIGIGVGSAAVVAGVALWVVSLATPTTTHFGPPTFTP